MAGKLIETVSGLGGCMLEAGTWLRGTRTVKTQIEVIYGFIDGKLANDYDDRTVKYKETRIFCLLGVANILFSV